MRTEYHLLHVLGIAPKSRAKVSRNVLKPPIVFFGSF